MTDAIESTGRGGGGNGMLVTTIFFYCTWYIRHFISAYALYPTEFSIFWMPAQRQKSARDFSAMQLRQTVPMR